MANNPREREIEKEKRNPNPIEQPEREPFREPQQPFNPDIERPREKPQSIEGGAGATAARV